MREISKMKLCPQLGALRTSSSRGKGEDILDVAITALEVLEAVPPIALYCSNANSGDILPITLQYSIANRISLLTSDVRFEYIQVTEDYP